MSDILIYLAIAYVVIGLFFGGLTFCAVMAWSHNAGWKSVNLKEAPTLILYFILFVMIWPYLLWNNLKDEWTLRKNNRKGQS